ncbi:MAG: uncharacterized protein PWP31_1893 [Clostridia bacterium]|nr:uncharacterized protein [Clostridia bacterium]
MLLVGGGDLEIGFLWALNVAKERKDIVLIDPADFPDDTLAVIAGCLGAPVVLTEKPPNGNSVFEKTIIEDNARRIQRTAKKILGAIFMVSRIFL